MKGGPPDFIDGIKVENMGSVIWGTPFDLKIDLNDLHYSQKEKKPIALALFFFCKVTNEEKPSIKIASIRVPTGTPVSRVRPLISHVENELSLIYGKAKRANFVMVAKPKENEAWETQFEIPLTGVYYV